MVGTQLGPRPFRGWRQVGDANSVGRRHVCDEDQAELQRVRRGGKLVGRLGVCGGLHTVFCYNLFFILLHYMNIQVIYS